MKEVRPTSGRVLLALFSVLNSMSLGNMRFGNVTEGWAFLDLFAGTGQVGIEALKRGASSVVMVEVLKNRAAGIERALPRGCGADVTVLSLELRRALSWLTRRGRVFDVVFADPPYNEGWGASLLQEKALPRVLKREGVLVVEHASREALFVPETWTLTDVRSYGESSLTFLRKPEGEEERSDQTGFSGA
ncbi:MAG: RsmD family RNA methyltransferase [Synergistaceae bacterium]|jgi:16S rRNA (guanine(966)-N(2))-methyltransferase RsmD|nr:RsmD family RNA methyltransferase [Synergistaceae bacterium]